MDRIIMLLDMDCFYVQVEQRDRPETKGKPCVVVQYNDYKGGGILAVSYEARDLGIKRGMFGDVVHAKHPDVILFKVPEKRGKAELTKYRTAGAEVIQCIADFTKDVERASIDEAFVDLTDIVNTNLENTENYLLMEPNDQSFVVTDSTVLSELNLNQTETNCISLDMNNWINLLSDNFIDGKRLAIASALVYKIRQSIFNRTGFQCSAGIAPNKTLAKLACSLNKPNKQTLVPVESLSILLENTPLTKIRNLGGKLGNAVIEQFKVNTLGQLSLIPLSSLIKEFGDKTANWLYNLARGFDSESVASRSIPQSVGCSKNFLGPTILTSTEQIERWLKCLVEELLERLIDDHNEYHRQPSRLILYVRTTHNTGYSGGISRTLSNGVLQSIISNLFTTKPTNSIETVGKSNLTELYSQHVDKIVEAALSVLKEVFNQGESPSVWDPGITCLGLSAGKFAQNQSVGNNDIRSLFQKQHQQQESISSTSTSVTGINITRCKQSIDKESRKRFFNLNATTTTTTATTNTTSFNTTNVSSSSGSSFFKRLCVAEISDPSNNSNKLNVVENMNTIDSKINSTTLSTETRSSYSVNQKKNFSESIPDLELDSDSRASCNSDSQGYFVSYTDGDWIICDQCGSRISVWLLPEHEDFHTAQRIQNEWKIQTQTNIDQKSTKSLSKIDSNSNQTNRSNQSNKLSKHKLNKAAQNTLDKFFSSKNTTTSYKSKK